MKITIYLIPSHVGIPSNEKANQLSAKESLAPSNIVHNRLSETEQETILRFHLRKKS